MSRDPEEERFARGDSQRYSGWSSAITIAVIVIVLGIVLLVYYPKVARQATDSPERMLGD